MKEKLVEISKIVSPKLDYPSNEDKYIVKILKVRLEEQKSINKD